MQPMTELIQRHASNRLDPATGERKLLAGILGDRPSQYAKSPSLWNRAFSELGLDAIFVPLDVEPNNLAPLVQALRETRQVVGFSVTVPYKTEVIKLLDELDPKARQIGAVNTVARSLEGKLVGYNTDGQGFIDMLTRLLPGQDTLFFENLDGRRALLLGAGGAARAVAFFLGEALGSKGALTISNRDPKKGEDLAASVSRAYGNATHIKENEIGAVAPTVDLIINATTKGQSGIRNLPGGRATILEPYCALAPALPAVLDQRLSSGESAFYAAWYKQSFRDIEANHSASNAILVDVPEKTAFVDLVYAPLETRMMAMARWSGHRTLNGKGMNISQAADAFVNRVMTRHLVSLGWDLDETYRRVYNAMANVW
jgi:shikimate dehydrogenase